MSALKFVLALPLQLDCQALAQLLREKQCGVDLVAETDLKRAVSACYKRRPEVFLVGLGFDREATLKAAAELVRADAVKAVAFLDQTLAVYRAAELRKIPRTCYFTRRQSIDEILGQIHSVLHACEADAETADDVFWATFQQTMREHDEDHVLSLSSREQAVFRELIDGNTVEGIASKLHIAYSTVDNHKARLMRKLEVHRAAALLHVAFRAGVFWTRFDAPCDSSPELRKTLVRQNRMTEPASKALKNRSANGHSN